ncbi:Major_facilitator superfamily protein [Hexamita inflata]|uniref:Lysosomal dipeptide transporter MFSD1 n=1 Tax=Hexamita inflata TaxID=28002 RepID=A0AA86PH15_9EUKA|nr:Major facilitator superfamily protein [Hexamita inflata]
MKTIETLAHILFLSIIIAPNCMFYASANIMSDLLKQFFQSEQVVQLAFSLISIPSIFSIVTISLMIDAFSTVYIFPILQFICCIGTLLTAISDPAHSQALYLIGRFMYGIAGECTLTSQSKIISKIIPQQFHSMAYSIAFCFYMLGEAIAGWVLPIQNSLQKSMYFVLGLQVFGLMGAIFYSFYIKIKGKQNVTKEQLIIQVAEAEIQQAQSKSTCQELFSSLKQLKLPYFLLLIARIAYTCAKSTYDTRSVSAFQEQLNVSKDKAVKFVVSQSITSAVSFIFFSIVSVFMQKSQYLVLFGAIVVSAAYLVFTLSTNIAVGYTTSILIGISFGAFASNASALLVKLAGKSLGASALGIVFSVQYLIMSGMIPLAEYIGQFGEYINGWIYFGLALLCIVLLVIIIQKWVGW